MAITTRPFEPTEWAVFRDFRLQALKASPGVFGESYEKAVTRSPQEWRDGIKAPTHQIFGLFDGERLIGIAGAVTWREDPSGATALLVMSFILPEYRGRGLSSLLYEARMEWIRNQSKFKRVIVSHRIQRGITPRHTASWFCEYRLRGTGVAGWRNRGKDQL
jgi:GNAT superfamily N-acetyltransferase